MMLRAPITWYGGKGHNAKHIVPYIVQIPHQTYVEPFGGAGSVLLSKPPSPVEVYNDIHSHLVNFFKVIADEKSFEKFFRKASLSPYSRQYFYECRDTINQEKDEIERAVKFFIMGRQCFGGDVAKKNPSWGMAVTESSRGMGAQNSRFLSSIEMLPEIHRRLQRVQIEHQDFKKIFETYDTPKTLFYVDPPYHKDTRKDMRYAHEFTNDQHADLVTILLKLKGRAILSGYDHSVYTPLMEAGWSKHQWACVASSSGRVRSSKLSKKGDWVKNASRTETLWISPKKTEGVE